MSPTAFFLSLLVAWVALYIALPVWLLLRGWITSGGVVQLVGALLPGIWHGIFWPDEAGSFGLLTMLLVPIPLWIIAIGLVAGLVQAAKWIIKSHQRRGL